MVNGWLQRARELVAARGSSLAPESGDEPTAGFQVRPMSELPTRMLERMMRRRFDPNPERVSSDYDELRWG